MKKQVVTMVTSEFIRQITSLLLENGFVVIDDLGALKVVKLHCKPHTWTATGGRFKKGVRNGTRKILVSKYIRVHFSKATKLKKLLNEQL